MSINNLKAISQFNYMNQFFSKIQGSNKEPVNSLFDEETAAKNRARYFDKNGEPLNSSGEAGRYIGGGKDWKKMIPVSDQVKIDLAKVIKQDFITTNGMGTPDGSKRNDVINRYLKTIPSDTRSSASWTLMRLDGSYGERIEALVRKNTPHWRPGEAFDISILDQIEDTVGGVDYKA